MRSRAYLILAASLALVASASAGGGIFEDVEDTTLRRMGAGAHADRWRW